MIIKPPLRIKDKWGEGHYQASRGDRKHNGIDIACYPGSEIISMTRGVITKYGYPYSDDLSFRYIEVTDFSDLKFRYFYIEMSPALSVGDNVSQHTILGISQKLGDRYPDITEHVHLEIKNEGGYIDPIDFI